MHGTKAVRHEQEISNAGRYKLDFAEIAQCKPVLLGLTLPRNLVKPFMSLYKTEWVCTPNGESVAMDSEWRERGYGFRFLYDSGFIIDAVYRQRIVWALV
jgi:hypothetical protein